MFWAAAAADELPDLTALESDVELPEWLSLLRKLWLLEALWLLLPPTLDDLPLPPLLAAPPALPLETVLLLTDAASSI